MNWSARDVTVSAADGLKLYVCERGPRSGDALPVVCLPGIARTSEDFSELAEALAGSESRPRRVLALDYRGRGRSEWDTDWRRYDLRVELDDLQQVLAACGVAEAVFVGTSRGGILAMALGASRPAAIRGAVINDIGPVIEARGLQRIRGYVGKLPQPQSIAEAVALLKGVSGTQFPGFSEAQWRTMARTTWREHDGKLLLAYDPKLMEAVKALDSESGVPPIWHLFEALKSVPVLAIRGELSDILSAETLAAMQAAHPKLQTVTVPGQGHAPLLDGDLVRRIEAFVASVEDAARTA